MLFGDIKGDKINPKKRGRYIFTHLLEICIYSCLILAIFSVGFFALIKCLELRHLNVQFLKTTIPKFYLLC